MYKAHIVLVVLVAASAVAIGSLVFGEDDPVLHTHFVEGRSAGIQTLGDHQSPISTNEYLDANFTACNMVVEELGREVTTLLAHVSNKKIVLAETRLKSTNAIWESVQKYCTLGIM